MNPRPKSEDELLGRAIQGDEAARSTLVRVEGPSVYALCRRLDPDPEDAFQEAWAKVFGALDRFDPDGPASIRTWVLRIAHRHLIDRHRRRQVRGTVVDLSLIPPVPSGVEERLTFHERQVRLEAALQCLPAPIRRVVILHHLEGVPLPDIAETEGCALGTVKSRLHRGRSRLMALLREETP